MSAPRSEFLVLFELFETAGLSLADDVILGSGWHAYHLARTWDPVHRRGCGREDQLAVSSALDDPGVLPGADSHH